MLFRSHNNLHVPVHLPMLLPCRLFVVRDAYCTRKNGYLYAKIKDGKYYTYTANNKKPSSKVFKNKKNTIIRLHKKNFYVGANGLINLNKGWKLNNNGLYTYYVEKKRYCFCKNIKW